VAPLPEPIDGEVPDEKKEEKFSVIGFVKDKYDRY
jgi:hypothetical protein